MGLKTVIAIMGTTGVGKTKLSIELAKLLCTEIINVDAMQMYKGFDIITNKATAEEMENIPHHLMDFVPIDKEYTIKDFERDALAKINELHMLNKIPILVGGTHYYLQSLLWNSSLIATKPRNLGENEDSLNDEHQKKMEQLQKKWAEMDNKTLHENLSEVDPKMAEHWHVNDRRKVLRSLEIFYDTGKKQSDIILTRESNAEDDKRLRFRSIIFWLYSQKDKLDSRLDKRVDKMVESGLFQELKDLKNSLKLLPCGEEEYDRGIKQAIGFKAFDSYLKALGQNDIDQKSLESLKQQGLEVMKQQTRRYAKKQVYWIKNQLLPVHFKSLDPTKYIDGDPKSYIYVLDGTDLDSWNANVLDKAKYICHEILENDNIVGPEDICSLATELLNPHQKKSDSSKLASWRKRICEQCSLRIDKKTGKLVEPVVINGDNEWEIHLQSKGHRKQTLFNKYKALSKIKKDENLSLTTIEPKDE